MDYKWYCKIDNTNSIEQGDLINNCPIIPPPKNIEIGETVELDVQLVDSIILSQSCDLVNDKIEIVLVCPFISLKTFIEGLPEDRKRGKGLTKTLDGLRQGNLPGYHLLNKCEEVAIKDYLVVDFRNVYGVQIEYLKNIASKIEKRNRLLPPYREHLSQAFARYFMRVGLPQDIVIEGY